MERGRGREGEEDIVKKGENRDKRHAEREKRKARHRNLPCNTDFKTREKEGAETKDVPSERSEKLDTEISHATLTLRHVKRREQRQKTC